MINKNVLKALVLMFFIFGCGGVLKDTVVPAENSALRYSATENRLAIEGVREVALFPFADYSHQQNLLHAELWGGNIKILEEITDHFIKNGILVAVQEDVNTVLVDNNVIQPLANQQLIYGSDGGEKTKFRTKVIGTPEYDLINVEHSEDMKDEIINVIKSEMAMEKAEKPPVQTPILQGATVGLSREMIAHLGEELGVDLIVRGRIIEYGLKDIDTYNPLQRGFLPVLIEPMKDALFGAADAKNYESDLEDVDSAQLWRKFGFVFGEKTEDDLGGTWDVLMEHSFGTLSNLHPRKKSVSSIVQIRMYVQCAKTGDVVWSNRVETEFTPHSNQSFNDKHLKTMFDKNIKRSVKLLMDDLFKCFSLKAEEEKEIEEKIASGKQDSIYLPDDKEGKKLEARLIENDVLIQELQDKIQTLENSKKISLQKVDGRTYINLPNSILFPSGTDVLNKEGIETLKTLSEVLEKYPDRNICIEGHTDNVPVGPRIMEKYATNWELSTARAIQVMKYMSEHFKLNQSLMSVKGYGYFKPVAPNDTPEGKAKNRRVVIVVDS